jgi:MYXO-CTERM domain-containing protein
VQGETGWPTGGGAYENTTYNYAGTAVPSVANQARFIRDLDAAIAASTGAGQAMEVWLFEAFDEPWKGAEGTVGGSWGFLDGAGAPKHDAVTPRLVPLSATQTAPGTVVITLDRPAAGAAATRLSDPAAWELSGGTITGATLSADGTTVTVTYTGGDAFKAVRAAAAACDVIARRRFVLGDPAAHPVPGGGATDAGAGGANGGGGAGGGGAGGTDADAGSGSGGGGSTGTARERGAVGCGCAVGGARSGGGVAALALLVLLARRRRR